MMIRQFHLLTALRRILSRTPFMSDYRRASNGRLVRFIDLRGAAARRRGGEVSEAT